MVDLLRGNACVEEFDLTAITETWVDTANKDFMSEYEIHGYQMFHKDRKGQKRRWGGTLCERHTEIFHKQFYSNR